MAYPKTEKFVYLFSQVGDIGLYIDDSGVDCRTNIVDQRSDSLSSFFRHDWKIDFGPVANIVDIEHGEGVCLDSLKKVQLVNV